MAVSSAAKGSQGAMIAQVAGRLSRRSGKLLQNPNGAGLRVWFQTVPDNQAMVRRLLHEEADKRS